MALGCCTVTHAGDQLRNQGGLESALARPRSYAHYEDADLALQAAVLAHGIAEGQTFIDGNKRLALVAMLTFLEVNGYGVEASDPELADWILSLSAGEHARLHDIQSRSNAARMASPRVCS